jgi:hypothetical protein
VGGAVGWASRQRAVKATSLAHAAVGGPDRQVDEGRAGVLGRAEVDEEAAEVEVAQAFQPSDQRLAVGVGPVIVADRPMMILVRLSDSTAGDAIAAARLPKVCSAVRRCIIL